jgi:hypothetical protein
LIERLRESGIENVERILELGEEKLKEIPGVGDKTAAKIMEAARDLFEEVEIEVPEGMDLPTAIKATAPDVKGGAAKDRAGAQTDAADAGSGPAGNAPAQEEAPEDIPAAAPEAAETGKAEDGEKT